MTLWHIIATAFLLLIVYALISGYREQNGWNISASKPCPSKPTSPSALICATKSECRTGKYLEPVFTIFIGRFDGIKARIQGKKRSKVGHLASIFNAVAAFLGHKRCL